MTQYCHRRIRIVCKIRSTPLCYRNSNTPQCGACSCNMINDHVSWRARWALAHKRRHFLISDDFPHNVIINQVLYQFRWIDTNTRENARTCVRDMRTIFADNVRSSAWRIVGRRAGARHAAQQLETITFHKSCNEYALAHPRYIQLTPRVCLISFNQIALGISDIAFALTKGPAPGWCWCSRPHRICDLRHGGTERMKTGMC